MVSYCPAEIGQPGYYCAFGHCAWDSQMQSATVLIAADVCSSWSIVPYACFHSSRLSIWCKVGVLSVWCWGFLAGLLYHLLACQRLAAPVSCLMQG